MKLLTTIINKHAANIICIGGLEARHVLFYILQVITRISILYLCMYDMYWCSSINIISIYSTSTNMSHDYRVSLKSEKCCFSIRGIFINNVNRYKQRRQHTSIQKGLFAQKDVNINFTCSLNEPRVRVKWTPRIHRWKRWTPPFENFLSKTFQNLSLQLRPLKVPRSSSSCDFPLDSPSNPRKTNKQEKTKVPGKNKRTCSLNADSR